MSWTGKSDKTIATSEVVGYKCACSSSSFYIIISIIIIFLTLGINNSEGFKKLNYAKEL